jgi:hypothetical protein
VEKNFSFINLFYDNCSNWLWLSTIMTFGMTAPVEIGYFNVQIAIDVNFSQSRSFSVGFDRQM